MNSGGEGEGLEVEEGVPVLRVVQGLGMVVEPVSLGPVGVASAGACGIRSTVPGLTPVLPPAPAPAVSVTVPVEKETWGTVTVKVE